MFQDFANVWTPVTLSRRLGKRPLSVQVAGEKLVLFRDGRGGIGALLDRCPHRGAALSRGTLTPEGCIRCPYHGYEFASDGACTKVKLHPDAKRELMGTTAFPAREIAGLIWLFTAPVAQAPSEPIIPPGLADPRLAHSQLEQIWEAHWGRVIENMLDTPHVPYVHAGSFGSPLARREKPGSRISVVLEETPNGCRSSYDLDGFRVAEDWLEFTRPNRMSNATLTSRRVHREFCVWAVPISATRTRLIVATARGFGRYNPLFRLFEHLGVRRILSEDRPVVESQTPVVLPRPTEERSVPGDVHTLRFRKYYFEELHGSSAVPSLVRRRETKPTGTG